MIIIILKILIPFLIIFNIIPLLIWAERKGSAFIQGRHGPNRASIKGLRLGGLLHSLSDVIKLMTKEDFTPGHVTNPYFTIAPFLTLAVACVTFAVIPFAHPITINGTEFVLQPANINVGVLYVLAMASMGVFGIMLAGWAANNKYALLGGARSSAQMISYEISMGLSLLSVLMLGGSLELHHIITNQTENMLHWNIVRQPIAFFLFTVAAFAETNRNPFDLPEGESEIVGYHVEYSSMKFAMFFMAEYAHMIVASCLISILFFGGWQVPFLSTDFIRAHADTGLFIIIMAHAVLFMIIGAFLLKKFKKGHYGDKRDYEVIVVGAPLLLGGLGLALLAFFTGSFNLGDTGSQIFTAFIQFGVFMAKVLFFCWLFIWVRWTLPRFRYDQLMNIGWKGMIPLALANLVITSIVMLFV
ncbi:NADH-quinone oxidoreductase subunit H [bacterium]|nr:NADH-quinone oxidoreductase subunit H [bacterium]